MEEPGPPHLVTSKAQGSSVLRLHLNIYLYRGSGLWEGITKYRGSLTKVTVVVTVRKMELLHYARGHRWGRSAFTKLKGVWKFFWTLFTYLFGIDRIVKLQKKIENHFF